MSEAGKDQMAFSGLEKPAAPAKEAVEGPPFFYQTTRIPTPGKSVRLYELNQKDHPNEGRFYDPKGTVVLKVFGNKDKFWANKDIKFLHGIVVDASLDPDIVNEEYPIWYYVTKGDIGREERNAEQEKRAEKKGNPDQTKLRKMPSPIKNVRHSEADDIPF